jgi:hypothetical protein
MVSVRYRNRLRIKHQVDRLYANLLFSSISLGEFSPTAARLPSAAFQLLFPTLPSIGVGVVFLQNRSPQFILSSGFLLRATEQKPVFPSVFFFPFLFLRSIFQLLLLPYANFITIIKNAKKT